MVNEVQVLLALDPGEGTIEDDPHPHPRKQPPVPVEVSLPLCSSGRELRVKDRGVGEGQDGPRRLESDGAPRRRLNSVLLYEPTHRRVSVYM